MNLNKEKLDKIAMIVAANVALGVATFVGLIATVAFFGPKIAPYMSRLPWSP